MDKDTAMQFDCNLFILARPLNCNYDNQEMAKIRRKEL